MSSYTKLYKKSARFYKKVNTCGNGYDISPVGAPASPGRDRCLRFFIQIRLYLLNWIPGIL